MSHTDNRESYVDKLGEMTINGVQGGGGGGGVCEHDIVQGVV